MIQSFFYFNVKCNAKSCKRNRVQNVSGFSASVEGPLGC